MNLSEEKSKLVQAAQAVVNSWESGDLAAAVRALANELDRDFSQGQGEFHLTYNQGKAVQEILQRYVSEELAPRVDDDQALCEDGEIAQSKKDIIYINSLIELFD